MLSTKNIFDGINDIPSEWIFEHYLNISEKLMGQDVKLFSVFKHERTPSMYVYYNKTINQYRFKDFSSGHQGDAKLLVMLLYNLSYGNMVNKVTADYAEYLKLNMIGGKRQIRHHDKYKVVDYEMRHWTNIDQQYWTKFYIGSKLLERYNVVPLKFFTMQKTESDGSVSSILFEYNSIYGYFKADGKLYKIYSPKNLDKKFIKVASYIQGLDQLTYQTDYLVIASSLKDIMCFRTLGYKSIEVIAPDSENTMIKESEMEKLKSKYKKVITLFDNDEAGLNSMNKYKERYGLNYVLLEMSKDLSDSVKDYGIDKVKEQLHPLLIKALKYE